MPKTQHAHLVSVGLSLTALAIALASLFSDSTTPPSASVTQSDGPTREEMADLEERLTLLEARRNARGTENTTTAPMRRQEPERADAEAATSDDSGLRELVAELQTRLFNLEKAQKRRETEKRELADPDSIPAALAVLLASRGVVTKVGDIEAIQENLEVLAALAADTTRGDWDRIEAYRGMLMFGYDHPEKCEAAQPGLATILWSSKDPRARTSAAAMLGSYHNPRVTDTVLAAFSRETDPDARMALARLLLNRSEDPKVLPVLQEAARQDPDMAVRLAVQKRLEAGKTGTKKE